MAEEPVHPLASSFPTRQKPFYPFKRTHGQMSAVLLTYLVALSLLCSSTICAAQTLVNGQSYTNGLAIINAPAPRSQQHAGSNLPISIEISGNGKLPFSAFTPGSRLASSYELLEIYLVSSQTNLNLTISSGTGLLTGESGTVRHHDTVIPSCVPTGEYNLTFYETAYINSQFHFTITPIPISILNNAGSAPRCNDGVNELQAQPQPDSDFGQSPFLPNSDVEVSTAGFLPGADPTATSPITTGPTTIVEGPAPTLPPDQAEPSGSVTLVIVAQVVTTAMDSQNQPMTTSYMTTRTTTVPMSTAVSAGVIPINAGTARLDHLTCIFVPLLITIWAITLTLRLD